MSRYYLVTNGPRGISTWYVISSRLSLGNILKFDVQESQCRTCFIGKAFRHQVCMDYYDLS